MPAGRPTEYSEEIAQRICEEIAGGSNLNRLCALDEFPERKTIYNWFGRHPNFLLNYTHARESRAEGRFDKIDDVIEDMRVGTIDSNAARVQIDAIKWQAGKEKPTLYGDRTTQVQVTVPVDAEKLKALTEIPQEDLEAAIALGEKLAAALAK